jgi:enamine deaminase RidA (YjgF/YER057c/UK114 family)
MRQNGRFGTHHEVFGAIGGHPRGAIGVAQLPLEACVEIERIAEVDPSTP